MTDEDMETAHFSFLLAGGVLTEGDWTSRAAIPGAHEAMAEAGRKFLALKSCLAAAAIADPAKIWALVDEGKANEVGAVEQAAAVAAQRLEAILGMGDL